MSCERDRGRVGSGARIVDRRRVKLERVLRPGYIPMGSGRPERDGDREIGRSDVVDVVIALETSRTWVEFLSRV